MRKRRKAEPRMTLRIDHLFICSAVGAPEADELLGAGMTEGSPNTHPGQGTANRRFFFENGYLELLWVQHENEARSERTAPTRLWDRWTERHGSANPFGICFSSPQRAESRLPFTTRAYRPRYLADGREILFANGIPLSEPEMFALGWPHAMMPHTQPIEHPAGLRTIRRVSAGLFDPTAVSAPLRAAIDAGLLGVHQSDAPELIVEFNSDREIELSFPSLSLTMIGRQERAA